jgi:hypothetical protein
LLSAEAPHLSICEHQVDSGKNNCCIDSPRSIVLSRGTLLKVSVKLPMPKSLKDEKRDE